MNHQKNQFVKRVKVPNYEAELPNQESIELKMCWKRPFYAMSNFDETNTSMTLDEQVKKLARSHHPCL